MLYDTPPRIRTFTLAHLIKRGRWRTEAMRTSSDHTFLWITRGQGRITVSGITRGYQAHNAIFIPAGHMHGFEVGRHVLGSTVMIPPGDATDWPDEPVHLRAPEGRPQFEVTHIVDSLHQELSDTRAEHQKAAELLIGLLSVWMSRQPQTPFAPPRQSGGASERIALAFTDVLERDFRTGKTIAAYARDIGVTPTHLSRACKETSGRPASALLSDRLVAEACSLLTETKTPIQEIALQLGFTTPGYFSRVFHQHTGKTPRDFRKSDPV